MKDLLKEYLSSITEEKKHSTDVLQNTVITYMDKNGQLKTTNARRVQREGPRHPAWPQYQKLKATSKVSSGDEDPQAQTGDSEEPKDPNVLTDPYETKEVDSNTAPSKVFTLSPMFGDDGVSDEDYRRNPKIRPTENQVDLETLDTLFKSSDGSYKFPKKYVKVLQRILNSEKGKQAISDYTDVAGAGQPASQAGELLTVMMVSIKDDDAAVDALKYITEHLKSLKPKNRPILTSGWVKSAFEVRQGAHARYNKLYGSDWEIEGIAWDVVEEAEDGLGFENYLENKGYSTDMTVRLSVSTSSNEREVILNEVSLKKDVGVNLLNTTSNRLQDIVVKGFAPEKELREYEGFNSKLDALGPKSSLKKHERGEYETIEAARDKIIQKYATNIPQYADVAYVKKQQDSIHREFIQSPEALEEINEFLLMWKSADEERRREISWQIAADLNQQNKEKYAFEIAKKLDILSDMDTFMSEDDYSNALAQLTGTLKYQQKTNLSIMRAIEKTSEKENTLAAKYAAALIENSHKHSEETLNFLLSDKRAKRGLVRSIRDAFPLKSILLGEETMSLGSIIADSNVLGKIFGTVDPDRVEQSLTLRETPPPPSIVYKAKGTGDAIPIAEVVSRPDGIGYGSAWRLDMKLHKEFGKLLRETSKEIYG